MRHTGKSRVTVWRKAFAAGAVGVALLVSACQQEEETRLPPVGLDRVAAEKAACEADGGSFRSGGKGVMVCFRTPRDAGKQCSKAGDCEGDCLARSGTCSPLMPLYGCQEVLTANGARMTQCID